ncbi:MAG: helix-turn-helix transcriptional regulator [Anaerolineae bacterium]
MNRIDRLFAILLRLQSKKQIRAQDLAKVFEVSQRTIYRDIAALSEMGVPIVSLPGEGYELMEGFYLPPLIFTPAEASALFLGAHMLVGQAAGQLPADAERALTKIAAVLPHATRQQVERLNEIIHFVLPQARFNLDDPRLVSLQQAILERRVVHLQYHSYSRNETTKRDVEPHQLTYSNGAWYVTGYDRLRQAIRAFRLDRVDGLKLLAEPFKPRSSEQPATEPIIVRVRFAEGVVRWVRERQHYAFQQEELTPDGTVMTYRLNTLSEMTPWLLGWGASAEVLSPPELRREIRQIALKLADILT